MHESLVNLTRYNCAPPLPPPYFQMRFPLILDMNKYVDQPGQPADGAASCGTEAGGAPGGFVRERSDFQVGGSAATVGSARGAPPVVHVA